MSQNITNSPESPIAQVDLFHLRFSTRREKSHPATAPQVALLDTMIFEDLVDWSKGRGMPGSGARLLEVIRCTSGMSIEPRHAMEESAWSRRQAITELDLYHAHTILAMLLSPRHPGERWLREGAPGVVRAVRHRIPSSAELGDYADLIVEGQEAWFLRSAIPIVLLRRLQQRSNKGDRPERRISLFDEYQRNCIKYGGGLDPWSSTLALVRLFQRRNNEPLSRLLKGVTDSHDPSQLRAGALNVARDLNMLRRLLDIEAGKGRHRVPRPAVLLTRDRGLVGLHKCVSNEVTLDGEHAGLYLDEVVNGLDVAPETKSTLASLLLDHADALQARPANANSKEMLSLEVASKRLDAVVQLVATDP